MVLDNYPYEVSNRNIKYPRVELKTGKLLFVLPSGYNVDTLYQKHRNWIYKKISFIEECLDNARNKELVERSDEDFKKLIYKITMKESLDLKVKINRIYFRRMRTKWASLSFHKNLTVNRFMKYLPEYLIGYIIFHELGHVIEKKHNNRFWEIVGDKYKGYQNLERELFEYWFKISEEVGL